MLILVTCLLAYLIGSIPTGYLMARAVKGIDIRQHGSGNIGMTNVWRVVGPGPGFACLVLDILKGYLPVMFLPLLVSGIVPLSSQGQAPVIASEPQASEAISFFLFGQEGSISLSAFRVLLAFCVVAGHNWTIFLKFKGGKGVATGAGALAALSPACLAVGGAAFGVIFFFSRIVSLGSITAAVAASVAAFVFHEPREITALIVILSTVLVWRHRPNIRRLLRGEEPRAKRKEPPP